MNKKQIVKDITKLLEKLIEEPAKKITSVWDLGVNDKCWIITGKGQVMAYETSRKMFPIRREKGDAFLTKESADRELMRRKDIALTSAEGLTN